MLHAALYSATVAVVNLDPANDMMKYKPDIDITDLITISDVMDTLKLGPNGGLVYCMEYLEQNMSWLEEELARVKGRYLLIDCPGQVELYTHNTAVHNIVQRLIKMDIRLVAVHLVDSHYCSDASKFISVLLTSLTTMLQMELPHVNVLSKCDLIQKYGKLAFNLDFYTEVLDLSYILDQFKDKEIMLRVMKAVDKANGYVFGDLEERNLQEMLSCAAGAEFEYEKIQNIQEHFVDDSAGTSTENG
ncbi:GPN2-like protein [Mya arenaria]|uniref:GPN-loop GTPase 2 n=1 Tax=Mya arenaria TaxID=6604 RepID=A0ABY7DUK1_MYAAR|nr:GPN2-like protein [Mya arenaria]